LAYAASNVGRNVWSQGCKQAEDLNLQGDIGEGKFFVRVLNSSATRLGENEDQIKWSRNHQSGVYTAKLGYADKMEEDQVEARLWQWQIVWKMESSLKEKNCLSIALDNRILSWDNCQKRNMQGPGQCILCKSSVEIVDHFLFTIPFLEQFGWKSYRFQVEKISWKTGLCWIFHSCC
jgi:hypothetical protein